MSDAQARISIRGVQTKVPLVKVGGIEFVTTGRWLKIAAVRDEDYCEGNPVSDPQRTVRGFVEAGGRADLFSFFQRPFDAPPRYPYPMHWDNFAVLPVGTYEEWWTKLSQETRRNVRTAAKRGLTVTASPFDDDFVRGIMGIYNETPIRQGRKFWHYGKDFETVKRENGTYHDRAEFIGAYAGGQMVGFIKMVYVNGYASIMQILSRADSQDKRPTNALIAKAVEICAQKNVSRLLYCKYTYHKNHQDALTEFKRRNGFEQLNYPRYFVPLTLKGRLAVTFKLQLGISEVLPAALVVALLRARAKYNSSLQKS
jgi:hypothetical protein